MKYKTCPGIILTSVGDDYYLVTSRNRIRINETAAFYWKKLSEGMSISELRAEAVREYDIEDSEELEQQITELIDYLKTEHLIVRKPERNGTD